MRIVIVGNGPSPVGKGLGSIIDSMDIVIRMHDCHLLDNVQDYGVKYDYGILPSPWLRTALSQIRIIPSKGWLVYILGKQKAKKIRPRTIHERRCVITLMDSFIGNDLKHHPPTRGLCAIIMALIHLKPTSIYLAGFDSVLNGKIIQYHHTFSEQELPQYIGTTSNDRHNFYLEKIKLDKLSKLYEIPIQDICLCI